MSVIQSPFCAIIKENIETKYVHDDLYDTIETNCNMTEWRSLLINQDRHPPAGGGTLEPCVALGWPGIRWAETDRTARFWTPELGKPRLPGFANTPGFVLARDPRMRTDARRGVEQSVGPAQVPHLVHWPSVRPPLGGYRWQPDCLHYFRSTDPCTHPWASTLLWFCANWRMWS